MKTELICVGTELLTGKINTNISYLGEKLNIIGLNLDCAVTVSDVPADMEQVFNEVFGRSDIIIITGGLGPTFDDLTRDITAKVLNKKLVINHDLLQQIVKRFTDRGIDMPKINERQAYLVENALPMKNVNGTAPGQLIETKFNKSMKYIFLLPGPPNEMQAMFETSVLPYLKNKYENKIVKSKVLHIHGLSESSVDELIQPILETERNLEKEYVTFAILAHKGIIDVKTTVSGQNELLIDEMLHNIKKEFCDILKENIYGEDKQLLENVVGELLIKNKMTLSVAESCTGGLVSNRITNVSGSSVYFKGGIVSYSNETKVKVLGVEKATIDRYGAVSEQTAIQMARGVRELTDSQIGLSITGIAGPSGATEIKPVGLVYFGLVIGNNEFGTEKRFHSSWSRTDIKEFAGNYALDLIRRKLCGYS
jgi:nicotinamide-nucleotide amidase